MTITIDEAIKVLDRTHPKVGSFANPVINEAVQLGVEALKLIKKERKNPHVWFNSLLPGETEK